MSNPRKYFKAIVKPIWHFVRDSTLQSFGFCLGILRVDTEPWYWMRELLMFVPGEVGIAFRRVFYNKYLKRKSKALEIHAGVCIEHPQYAEFGDGVKLGRNVWINAIGGLVIGDNSGIGPYSIIHTANHNYSDPNVSFLRQGHSFRPVKIGSDVWLSASVRVLPGTQIGQGVVVVANTTLSGNIEDYAIVASPSVPRRIGSRGMKKE